MLRVGTREASCSCGQLRLEADGDPIAVSMCHCRACQRRTGSAFGLQAGYDAERVRIEGRYTDYTRISDEADERPHVFHFCPECGGTVFYTEPDEPDHVVVMVGAFADRSFPQPTPSSYGVRRHPWVVLPEGIQHDELWSPLQTLYDEGRYGEAADRAQDIIAAHPHNPQLLYNVACCESLAGRAADAIEHLARALALAPRELGALAAGDSDFDPIRQEPAFSELIVQD
jgi:hypothetical protein